MAVRLLTQLKLRRGNFSGRSIPVRVAFATRAYFGFELRQQLASDLEHHTVGERWAFFRFNETGTSETCPIFNRSQESIHQRIHSSTGDAL